MTKYPEKLARCQEEVDRLCGVDRSPNNSDFDQLMYLKATLNEVGSPKDSETCSSPC